MINLDEINTVYFDVLKEIGNIGAGNATTALAKMLDMKIDMKVPNVQLLEFKDLAAVISSEDEPVMGILLEVESDIAGSMMFFLELDSAHYLVNKLMFKDPDCRDEFTEIELSALKEIGNIISGSYLSALSSLTNMTITSSIPYLCIDMAGAILSVPAIEFGKYGDKALLIQTEFGDEVRINGYFILLPELDSYEKILNSLGIQL